MTLAQLQPYRYPPLRWSTEKWKEYKRIVVSLDSFFVPQVYRDMVMEALHDEISWDWYKDCDGCTCVSEPGWPSKYYPPCVLHDYMWRTNKGGMVSNGIFLEMTVLYHAPKMWSYTCYLGVTLSWLLWAKWKKLLFVL